MIRISASLVVLGLLTAGCGSKTNPTPTPTPAPTTRIFTASLSPANEVPPITAPNAEAGGSGTVTITFNLTNDANGNITAATANFSASFTGFPNGTALTAAHIHPGAVGVNGGAQVSTAISAGEVVFANGAGVLNKSNIALTVDQANSIIANPANFYFNVHTGLNPGGVARGQLVKIQ